jgi:hypothetical protein
MSRSGYSDDCDDNSCWLYRGAVKSAIEGRRGQAFLKEMLAAMDALPEPKLIESELEADGAVCAIGSVGRARGLDMKGLDPEDPEGVAAKFGVAPALVREIVFENDDEWFSTGRETPEHRFNRMRAWVVNHIRA